MDCNPQTKGGKIMPAKLDRCVNDVKAKNGSVDNPWAICNASINGKEIEEAMVRQIVETSLNKECGCQKKKTS